jgi:hypothetical protein
MAKNKKQTTDITPPKDMDSVRAAVIYMRGKWEVRRYTPELHGSEFIGLAEEYARKNKKLDYSVVLLEKV